MERLQDKILYIHGPSLLLVMLFAFKVIVGLIPGPILKRFISEDRRSFNLH